MVNVKESPPDSEGMFQVLAMQLILNLESNSSQNKSINKNAMN